MSISNKRVIIIGGGIGGTTTALAVQRLCEERKISVASLKVLERDISPTSRPNQGYSMSIRYAAIQVIDKLGLRQRLIDLATPGHRIMMMSSSGKELASFPAVSDGSQQFVRMSRALFRQALLTALPSDLMQWDTIAEDVTARAVGGSVNTSSNDVELVIRCTNGATYVADVVIVCDGSRSRIRQKLLPAEELRFKGAVLLTGRLKLEHTPPSVVYGPIMVLGHGSCVFCAPVDDQEAMWGVGIRSERRDDKKLDQEAIFREAKECCKDYAEDPLQIMFRHTDPKSTSLINMCDHEPMKSGLVNLPVLGGSNGLQTVKANLIFIGDANHAMTPFSANGANMAVVDAYELASRLTDSAFPTVHSAFQSFDAEMIPRNRGVISIGSQSIQNFITTSWLRITLRNSLLRLAHVLMNHGQAVKHVFVGALAVGTSYLGWRYYQTR